MTRILFYTVTCLAFSLNPTFAQQVSVDVNKSNQNRYYAEVKLDDYIVGELGKEYRISSNSFLEVSWKIDFSKVMTLEGMNSQLSGSPRIAFRFVNKLTNKDSVFYYNKTVSSSSKDELANLLAESYINDRSNLALLNKNISLFFSDQFVKNCSKGTQLVNEELNKENFSKALQLISFFNASPCKKEVAELRTKVLSAYGTQVCENDMQKIKVMAASGVEYQMIRAVDMLYRIPPKSPCSDEAIKVSKEIGEYMLKKSPGNSERINVLIKIYNDQDINSWTSVNTF